MVEKVVLLWNQASESRTNIREILLFCEKSTNAKKISSITYLGTHNGLVTHDSLDAIDERKGNKETHISWRVGTDGVSNALGQFFGFLLGLRIH